MKVSFWVPARDKEGKVHHTVKSVLEQNYEGMEILLSDQGSTDNTYAIMEKMASEYKGPNEVKLLKCPDTEFKGMAGFNRHMKWLHDQTDAELIIVTSADDWNHPDRARRIVEVYKEHKPSLIGTAINFVMPDGSYEGTTGYPNESRFVTAREHLERLVGGSSSMAWSREFYEKVGFIPHSAIVDVYYPFLATQMKGFYFIYEPLYAYIRYADPNNTGLEGIHRAADETGKRQLEEIIGYQISTTLFAAGVKMDELGQPLEADSHQALMQQILTTAYTWARARDKLTMDRINPIPMRT